LLILLSTRELHVLRTNINLIYLNKFSLTQFKRKLYLACHA